jgi:hypothetical protein
MRPRWVLLGGVLLWVGLAAGCTGLPRRPTLPEDPLLASKKPVRGKAEYTPPIVLAQAEPVPPPEPSPVLLAASPALRQEMGLARQLYTVPVNAPRPLQGSPENDSSQSHRNRQRTVSYTP